MPLTARVNSAGHLEIGGLDTVELAKQFGTPLWIVDYESIRASAQACQAGLESYPSSSVLYAGKAFMCLAMCKIVSRLGMGIDVVSEGELYTALVADVEPANVYLHGNNKSDSELKLAIESRGAKIVVDGFSELSRLSRIANEVKMSVDILIRVTPGVEPDTHHYIKTGQVDSKFGIPLSNLVEFVREAGKASEFIKFRGIHAHIGSQSHDVGPYLEIVDILADSVGELKSELNVTTELLDLGGGLGIAYTKNDKPLPIEDWSRSLCEKVRESFSKRGLELPHLLLEPGRSIIGPAGVTIYKAGDVKELSDGSRYVALDGGMADNPRPATYNAVYTSAIASRMEARSEEPRTTLVGRYCESGDIIIKDAGIPAESGDLIAVFGTGAYNYSMASNYNRTGRPACILIRDGEAELILERESCEDLIRMDRVPRWLAGEPSSGNG